MANTDFRHLQALTDSLEALDRCLEEIPKPEGATIEHPLDEDVRNVLREINIAEHDEEYKILQNQETVGDINKEIT